ncbi:Uncharacterised protein [Cedecea lapagei]|uniref:Uncharacterized protein n=1 Tax=Cedecea lapagei TaxID=158823 RepID=A0A3S4JDN4_9ENTR|nr:Uncharacterised protein [Cedecea lapagei]
MAKRPGFKAAMQPQILLRCAHDLVLNLAVHIGRGGLLIFARVVTKLRLNHQLVARSPGFADQDGRQDGGFLPGEQW